MIEKLTSKKNLLIITGLLVCIAFCYPLFSDGLIRGHDTYFHLCRIEALKEAYLHGDFFPRLYYEQNFNFGYGTPLFYSDIFLIIPALIRISGVPIVITYKLFIFFCTCLTFFSMYYVVKKLSQNSYAGFLSAIIYLFTAYRITDVYVRGAVGEILAMIIIPIVVLEIYKVLYTESYSYKLLGVFFGLLLLSHNISFILMCGVFGIFICCNLKKLWKEKRRIFCIIKAVVLALGCLAFFLFPMLEQLSSGEYAINEFVNDSNISNNTLFFEQLFTVKINFGLAGHEFGRDHWMTTNTGLVALFLPLLISKIKKSEFDNYSFLLICTVVGYFCLIVCLNIFPWKQLNSLLSFMQFPWRLVIISSTLLSIVSGIFVMKCRKALSEKHVLILVSLLVLSIGIYQLSFVQHEPTVIFNDTPYSLIADDDYSGEHGIVTYYNQAELAAADYLPIKDNIDYRNYGDYVVTNNKQEFIDFTRAYNNISFSVESSNAESFYILPLVYYKGYVVDTYSEIGEYMGSIVPYPDDETYLVTFNPGERNEKIQYVIYYKGTKLQSISYGISMVFIFILVFDEIIKKGVKRICCKFQ